MRDLTGKELERWFIQFSGREAIQFIPKIPLKKLVQTLDRELSRRLDDCRDFMYNDFPNPEANAWVDRILIGNQEPRIPAQEKQDFIAYLLDSVVAMDVIIEVKTSQGQTLRIAVDVTADDDRSDEKVRKVKGLSDRRNRPGDNKNKNIPKIRKQLGIDKHLVLVLNNDESLLPSRDKLLNVLQTFAESPTVTGAVNLKTLKPTETLGYIARIKERKNVFKFFLDGYLDQAVRSVISNLEKLDGEVSQSEEDMTRSYQAGNFSWNLHDDNSVSITRINNGSLITAETATPQEMTLISNFLVEVHQTYLSDQNKPKDDLDPPDNSQRPKTPQL